MLQFSLAFMLGLVCAAFQSVSVAFVVVFVLFLLCALARKPALALCVFFALLGVLRWTLEETHSPVHIALRPTPQAVHLTGTVASDPFIEARYHQLRFLLSIQTVEGEAAEGVALVQCPALSRSPVYGETVEAYGKLDLPSTAKTPGEFDYRAYLKLKNVERVFQVAGRDSFKSIAPPPDHLLTRAAAARRSFQAACGRFLPEEQAALAGGLTLGLQNTMPDELKDPLRVTGTYHLLSVSGGHIALLALLYWGVTRAFRVHKKGAAGVLPFVLFGYALLVGGDAPSLRAAGALSLYFAAFLFAREPDALSALAAAALCFLLWQPRALFEVGFQLSFLTVATMLLWYPRLLRAFSKPREGSIRAFLKGAFLLSLVAQVGSAPLIAYYFQSFSLVSPFANLVCALLILFLLPLALLFWVLSVVPLLGTLGAFLLQPWLWAFLEVNRLAASIPFASIQTPAFGCGWLLVFYALLFGLAKETFEED